MTNEQRAAQAQAIKLSLDELTRMGRRLKRAGVGAGSRTAVAAAYADLMLQLNKLDGAS